MGERKAVPRLPLSAVRWFDGLAYTAQPAPEGKHIWKQSEVGVMNDQFVELKSGLNPGDSVIIDPTSLTPPTWQERKEARVAGLEEAKTPPQG